MLRIETLYPEIANLYGDQYQMEFLHQSLPDAQIMRTSLKEKPYFTVGDIDFLYMGPSSEEGLDLAVDRLRPYKERLREMIDQGVVFLFTGNAFEIFEEYIEVAEEVPGNPGQGRKIRGLGLFPFHAVRRMMHRYNELFLGTFRETFPDRSGEAFPNTLPEEYPKTPPEASQETPPEASGKDRKLIGFKTEFSYTYGDNSQCYAFKGIRGFGIHPGTNLEGIRVHNFFGTYLNGPIMINNPYFAKYLLKLAGVEDPKLAFEAEAIAAYEAKLECFEDPKTRYSET